MQLQNLKLIALAMFFICCADPENISELFILPEKLTEVSGIETTKNSDHFWTLQDSGNRPELYALDKKGMLAHTLRIEGVSNVDWEELASDSDGNLYIGDFGNNDNDRRDLAIYKISGAELKKASTKVSKKIAFHYPEQTNFPAEKSQKWFDAEAFFIHNKNFYLFTKDRSDAGMTRLYRIPMTEGNHTAEFLGTFSTGAGKKSRVTAADISNDGKRVVLISNKKAWLFDDFKGDDFFDGKVREIELGTGTQLEGVCFKDSTTVYLVDEFEKGVGGKVYEMRVD